jgi:asparagine synthase (glutamine-hydrolysing)
MCGITGFLNISDIDNEKFIKDMMSEIGHRGPDDSGYLSFKNIYLGMVRLSIIDIENGHQPMRRNNFSIVFNGEIFNYKEINVLLQKEGIRLNTNSDTETILAAYEAWGEECLKLLRGMFTFAILNHTNGDLFIARDRLGIKPLYFYKTQSQFAFSSEIKSILKHPKIKKNINQDAIQKYLSYRFSMTEKTFFKNIYKFPSGTYLKISKNKFNFKKYWHPDINSKFTGSFDDAKNNFFQLFDESVRYQTIGEKPLGAFLSGGLDSTAIVTSLSKNFDTKLKTFSIGFNWKGDELNISRQTAKKLKCEHTEIIFDKKDFENLPKIIWHLDEPIGDAIISPMYKLSMEASKSVSVIHSGEGADELLGGYFTHKILMYSNIYKKNFPNIIKDNVVENLFKMLPNSLLNYFFEYPGNLGAEGKNRLNDFLKISKKDSIEQRFLEIIKLFKDNDLKNLYKKYKIEPKKDGDDYINTALKAQYKSWLPDDILNKTDKLCMANSIESRVPFMDHKLVDFVNTLPYSYKSNLFKNKIILREYLKANGQNSVSKSKKNAFYIPIDYYLQKNPLRDIIEELLSENSIKNRGLLSWNYIKNIKKMSVQTNNSFLTGKKIFSIAMLELWFRLFIDQEKHWI